MSLPVIIVGDGASIEVICLLGMAESGGDEIVTCCFEACMFLVVKVRGCGCPDRVVPGGSFCFGSFFCMRRVVLLELTACLGYARSPCF